VLLLLLLLSFFIVACLICEGLLTEFRTTETRNPRNALQNTGTCCFATPLAGAAGATTQKARAAAV
jgi:hypothetical protein